MNEWMDGEEKEDPEMARRERGSYEGMKSKSTRGTE